MSVLSNGEVLTVLREQWGFIDVDITEGAGVQKAFSDTPLLVTTALVFALATVEIGLASMDGGSEPIKLALDDTFVIPNPSGQPFDLSNWVVYGDAGESIRVMYF